MSARRVRRRLALVVGAAALVVTPVVAAAAPLTAAQIYKPYGEFRFCAEAQLDIANIDEAVMRDRGISITTTIYGNFDTDFVSSKSAVDITNKRIVTREGIEYLDAAKTHPAELRCKMRTGESINKGAWPPGEKNNGGKFAVDPYYGFGSLADGVSSRPDGACTSVNQRTIDNVWSTLTPAQKAASPYSPEGADPTLITVPDDIVDIGPQWLETLPALKIDGSKLEVQSRVLISPTGNSIARFDGSHYCTFVAPQYLRDVLLGTQAVSDAAFT